MSYPDRAFQLLADEYPLASVKTPTLFGLEKFIVNTGKDWSEFSDDETPGKADDSSDNDTLEAKNHDDSMDENDVIMVSYSNIKLMNLLCFNNAYFYSPRLLQMKEYIEKDHPISH